MTVQFVLASFVKSYWAEMPCNQKKLVN